MQVTTDILQAWFTLFNQKYFGGMLPVPALSAGKSRTRLGSLTWKLRRRMFSKQPGEYAIRISNYYDADEITFKSVLLHEMIHLYIVSGRLKDTSPHGVIFRKEMCRINADGWHISVSAKPGGMKAAVGLKAKKRQRIVLAVVMNNGKRLFSVVGRNYVMPIDTAVRRSPDVKSHAWYMSSDEFFAAFPTVRTPKGRVVTHETFERMTASMQPLSL